MALAAFTRQSCSDLRPGSPPSLRRASLVAQSRHPPNDYADQPEGRRTSDAPPFAKRAQQFRPPSRHHSSVGEFWLRREPASPGHIPPWNER